MVDHPPKGHIFFLILTGLAGPFGLIVAGFTAFFSFDIPGPSGTMLDLDLILAMLGAMIICGLSLVMALIWALIYMRRGRGAVGSLAWVGVFAAILIFTNFVLFNGIVLDNLDTYFGDQPARRTYVQGVRYVLSKPDGQSAYLLLWPLLPILFFLRHWHSARSPLALIPS